MTQSNCKLGVYSRDKTNDWREFLWYVQSSTQSRIFLCQKENQTKDKELTGFIQMLRYYCVETRTTEMEVLKDDVLYQRVYHLFDKHKDFVMR